MLLKTNLTRQQQQQLIAQTKPASPNSRRLAV